MRKILLLNFIICCAFVNAQQIDTSRFYKDYNRLSDSVNCIYVKTYCEYHIKYGNSQSKQNDSISYVNYIKPHLKEVLLYDTLSFLLKTNGWTATANNILDPLNLNKNNQSRGIEDLLFLGRISEENAKILLPIQERLKKEITNEYSLKSNKTDMMSLIIAIVALAMSLIACGLLVLNILKKNKNYSHNNSYREEINDISRISTFIERTRKIEQQINHLNGLDIAVKELVRDVEVLKKNNNKNINKIETCQEKQSVIPIQNTQQQSGNYILLKPISDGYLKENDGVSAVFRAFNINSPNAQFEFCGDSAYAIENQDSIFKEEICICSGIKYKAQKVESVKPGKIQLEGNGKWKVIAQAEVKFS